MQNSYRRPSLFWPVLLIGLGVLLLLQNLGLLPPNLWAALVPLWPVLLIVLGLDMFIGRRSLGGVILVLLLSALVVAASLTWAALRAQQLPPGQTQGLIQSYRGAEKASVELNFDVGELNISALTASDYLMEGEAKNGPGEAVEQSYAVKDGEGQLTLSQQRNPLFAPFLSGGDSNARWDIRLASNVPLALEVNTGVGSANLDSRSLRLNFEMTVEIYEKSFVQDLAAYVESLRQSSQEVSLEELDGRPLLVRTRDALAWLCSPYL